MKSDQAKTTGRKMFQAEDGIRDAQESRGLGDVYKRQPVTRLKAEYICGIVAAQGDIHRGFRSGPVSYTHLTLPTKRIV